MARCVITIDDILAASIGDSKTDKVSAPLQRLLLIVIWANPGRLLTVLDLAAVTGAGERTVYRNMRHLRDLGYVEASDRIVGRGGGGTEWSICEGKLLAGATHA